MITYFEKRHNSLSYRILSAFIAFAFVISVVLPPSAAAQLALNLPVPGAMIMPGPVFTPTLIKGLTIHPENPLEFDFIVEKGQTPLQGEEFNKESMRLVKYFLASLTVPEDQMWVNLSPHEKERIISKNLGATEMGKDMLTQDYILKQLTASLMYPENELGKKFWDRIYKKAREQYGTAEIPVDTFNKVWIIPDKAVVYEHEGSVFVVESHLRVMLDSDYAAQKLDPRSSMLDTREPSSIQHPASSIETSIIKEIILPEIEKEVNAGETFANLRQIYHSMILATWYKKNLRESLLGQVYVDKSKTRGVDLKDQTVNQKIYEQYLEAFKKGVYNYIKEDIDPLTQEIIPRKYFSGGAVGLKESNLTTLYSLPQRQQAEIITAFRETGNSPDARFRSLKIKLYEIAETNNLPEDTMTEIVWGIEDTTADEAQKLFVGPTASSPLSAERREMVSKYLQDLSSALRIDERRALSEPGLMGQIDKYTEDDDAFQGILNVLSDVGKAIAAREMILSDEITVLFPLIFQMSSVNSFAVIQELALLDMTVMATNDHGTIKRRLKLYKWVIENESPEEIPGAFGLIKSFVRARNYLGPGDIKTLQQEILGNNPADSSASSPVVVEEGKAREMLGIVEKYSTIDHTVDHVETDKGQRRGVIVWKEDSDNPNPVPIDFDIARKVPLYSDFEPYRDAKKVADALGLEVLVGEATWGGGFMEVPYYFKIALAPRPGWIRKIIRDEQSLLEETRTQVREFLLDQISRAGEENNEPSSSPATDLEKLARRLDVAPEDVDGVIEEYARAVGEIVERIPVLLSVSKARKAVDLFMVPSSRPMDVIIGLIYKQEYTSRERIDELRGDALKKMVEGSGLGISVDGVGPVADFFRGEKGLENLYGKTVAEDLRGDFRLLRELLETGLPGLTLTRAQISDKTAIRNVIKDTILATSSPVLSVRAQQAYLKKLSSPELDVRLDAIEELKERRLSDPQIIKFLEDRLGMVTHLLYASLQKTEAVDESLSEAEIDLKVTAKINLEDSLETEKTEIESALEVLGSSSPVGEIKEINDSSTPEEITVVRDLIQTAAAGQNFKGEPKAVALARTLMYEGKQMRFQDGFLVSFQDQPIFKYQAPLRGSLQQSEIHKEIYEVNGKPPIHFAPGIIYLEIAGGAGYRLRMQKGTGNEVFYVKRISSQEFDREKELTSSLVEARDLYRDFYDSFGAKNKTLRTITREDVSAFSLAFLSPDAQILPYESRRSNGTFGVTEVNFLEDSATRHRMAAFQQQLKTMFGDKVYLVAPDKLHFTIQGLETQWADKAAGTKKELAMHAGLETIDMERGVIKEVRERARNIVTPSFKMQVAGLNWNPQTGIFWELRPYLAGSHEDPVMQRRKTWELPQSRPPHVTAAYFTQEFNPEDMTKLRQLVAQYQNSDYFGDIAVNNVEVIAYTDFSFNAGYKVLENVPLTASSPAKEIEVKMSNQDVIIKVSKEVDLTKPGMVLATVTIVRQGQESGLHLRTFIRRPLAEEVGVTAWAVNDRLYSFNLTDDAVYYKYPTIVDSLSHRGGYDARTSSPVNRAEKLLMGVIYHYDLLHSTHERLWDHGGVTIDTTLMRNIIDMIKDEILERGYREDSVGSLLNGIEIISTGGWEMRMAKYSDMITAAISSIARRYPRQTKTQINTWLNDKAIMENERLIEEKKKLQKIVKKADQSASSPVELKGIPDEGRKVLAALKKAGVNDPEGIAKLFFTIGLRRDLDHEDYYINRIFKLLREITAEKGLVSDVNFNRVVLMVDDLYGSEQDWERTVKDFIRDEKIPGSYGRKKGDTSLWVREDDSLYASFRRVWIALEEAGVDDVEELAGLFFTIGRMKARAFGPGYVSYQGVRDGFNVLKKLAETKDVDGARLVDNRNIEEVRQLLELMSMNRMDWDRRGFVLRSLLDVPGFITRDNLKEKIERINMLRLPVFDPMPDPMSGDVGRERFANFVNTINKNKLNPIILDVVLHKESLKKLSVDPLLRLGSALDRATPQTIANDIAQGMGIIDDKLQGLSREAIQSRYPYLERISEQGYLEHIIEHVSDKPFEPVSLAEKYFSSNLSSEELENFKKQRGLASSPVEENRAQGTGYRVQEEVETPTILTTDDILEIKPGKNLVINGNVLVRDRLVKEGVVVVSYNKQSDHDLYSINIRINEQNNITLYISKRDKKYESTDPLFFDSLPSQLPPIDFPTDKIRFYYPQYVNAFNTGSPALIFRGIMSPEERDALLKVSDNPNYQRAIEKLFHKSNHSIWAVVENAGQIVKGYESKMLTPEESSELWKTLAIKSEVGPDGETVNVVRVSQEVIDYFKLEHVSYHDNTFVTEFVSSPVSKEEGARRIDNLFDVLREMGGFRVPEVVAGWMEAAGIDFARYAEGGKVYVSESFDPGSNIVLRLGGSRAVVMTKGNLQAIIRDLIERDPDTAGNFLEEMESAVAHFQTRALIRDRIDSLVEQQEELKQRITTAREVITDIDGEIKELSREESGELRKKTEDWNKAIKEMSGLAADLRDIEKDLAKIKKQSEPSASSPAVDLDKKTLEELQYAEKRFTELAEEVNRDIAELKGEIEEVKDTKYSEWRKNKVSPELIRTEEHLLAINDELKRVREAIRKRKGEEIRPVSSPVSFRGISPKAGEKLFDMMPLTDGERSNIEVVAIETGRGVLHERQAFVVLFGGRQLKVYLTPEAVKSIGDAVKAGNSMKNIIGEEFDRLDNETTDIDVVLDEVRMVGEGLGVSSSPTTGDMFTKGGIDLNPALLDLQIKRDGNGVPLPLPMQPIGNMHIDGFLPIIINVTPVMNLPLLLGIADDDSPADSANSGAPLMELGFAVKEN